MDKRLLNWTALILVTIAVFAWVFGQGVTSATTFVSMIVAAALTAVFVGRRMFARRDRRMGH